MTTDFLAFHKDVFVEEGIEKIRSLAKKQFPFSYIYLIDDVIHFTGVLNLRDLTHPLIFEFRPGRNPGSIEQSVC